MREHAQQRRCQVAHLDSGSARDRLGPRDGNRQVRTRALSRPGKMTKVLRIASILLVSGLAASGCAALGAGSPPKASPSTESGSGVPAPPADGGSTPTVAGSPSGSPTPTVVGHRSGGKPLAGKIIGIDPGHNGLNGTDP